MEPFIEFTIDDEKGEIFEDDLSREIKLAHKIHRSMLNGIREEMEQTPVDFLPFRVITVATVMARSTLWATTASGGVVQSTIVAMPTAATWAMTTPVCTTTATISRTALVFVASGISPVE